MIIFKDFYIRSFKSCGKNGVSLCNLPLPLRLESRLNRQCAPCVVSVSIQRCICVCLCACLYVYNPVIDPAVQTVCVYMCVWVGVINNTAVLCFSPWAAAGTSWSSGRVWWAGRWAAACGPAAAATPDGKDGQNNMTPFNITATAHTQLIANNPSKTIYHRDYTVWLFVLCLPVNEEELITIWIINGSGKDINTAMYNI